MCLQCDVNELKNLRVVDVIDGDVLLVMHLPSNRTHVLKVRKIPQSCWVYLSQQSESTSTSTSVCAGPSQEQFDCSVDDQAPERAANLLPVHGETAPLL